MLYKNRRVFDEHYIFIYLSQTRWSVEHMQTIILLRYVPILLEVQHFYTMVNCFIGQKDQPHTTRTIALDKFFVL